jgi:hypothetical protein
MQAAASHASKTYAHGGTERLLALATASKAAA